MLVFFVAISITCRAGDNKLYTFYHMPDGLDVILINDSTFNESQIVCRSGYFTEGENSAGLTKCLTDYLTNCKELYDYGKSLQLQSATESQNYFTVFSYSTQERLIEKTFMLLDSMRKLKLNFYAVRSINRDLMGAHKVGTTKLNALMWSGNVYKEGYPVQPDSFDNYSPVFINQFRQKMFQNSNLLLLFKKTAESESFFNHYLNANIDFNSNFTQYIRNFNFQQERPLVYTYQLADFDSTNIRPLVDYNFLAPGASAPSEYIMAALVLENILNNPNSLTVQALKRQLGCAALHAAYDINNKSGNWTIGFETDSFDENLNNAAQLVNYLVKDTNQIASDFKVEMQDFAGRFIRNSKNNKADMLKLYWAGHNTNLIEKPESTWESLHPLHLHAFIIRYLKDQSCITNLKYDSLNSNVKYTPFDNAHSEYVLHYYANEFLPFETNTENHLKQTLQFLKANDWVSLQINCSAEKNEYLKVKDLKLLSFLDTVPSMKVISNQIVKTKWMRLDMVRSLKLSQYFYRNGIESNRLYGACRLAPPGSNSLFSANRKAFVTFFGIRKPINYQYIGIVEKRLDAIELARQDELFKKEIEKAATIKMQELMKEPMLPSGTEVLIGNMPR